MFSQHLAKSSWIFLFHLSLPVLLKPCAHSSMSSSLKFRGSVFNHRVWLGHDWITLTSLPQGIVAMKTLNFQKLASIYRCMQMFWSLKHLETAEGSQTLAFAMKVNVVLSIEAPAQSRTLEGKLSPVAYSLGIAAKFMLRRCSCLLSIPSNQL